MAIHGWGGAKKSSLRPLPKMKGIKGIAIPHQKLRTGRTIKGDQLPNPASFGLGSKEELQVYFWLRRRKIPFKTQQNFDGGDSRMGGQRADFVITQQKKIVEVLGPFHDTPGQALKDDRKWTKRRNEGWDVILVKWDEMGRLDQVLGDALGRPVMGG